MANMLIRGIIIYISVIFAVRLMGKRQIGELQPSELVVTFLLSQIASVPVQNPDSPLVNTLVTIFLLISLEILFSVLSIKSRKIRNLLQGSPILVIREGKLIESQLRRIRYTVEDLTEALRLKDVFDISQVQFAYIETNGSISVLLKSESTPVVISDTDIKKAETQLSCLVISDGKIIKGEFPLCKMTDGRLKKILKKEKVCTEDILLLTAKADGSYHLIKKDSRRKKVKQ